MRPETNRYSTMLGSALSLALLFLGSGCLGVVKDRTPKIPRSQRQVQIAEPPRIEVDFACITGGRDWTPPKACDKQRKAFHRVAGDFDFIRDGRRSGEEGPFTLRVDVIWDFDYKVASTRDESCMYILMMFMPCINKQRLVATAELLRPDGTLVTRVESSANRWFIVHFTGIWLLPAVVPSLPAYNRFSTNTYRNLLPQIGHALAREMDSHRTKP